MTAEAAHQLYGPWEDHIDSWIELQRWLNDVTEGYPGLQLVWRGARRAEWGMTNSLYRALQDVLKAAPTEDDMVLAEANTLKLARREWRFDHLAALELMAHLQHLGGPTRLLDVSVNPLIATWFAVERNEADDRFDGRLFAFSVDRRIELAPEHNGRFPRWHTYRTESTRRQRRWGTGDGRRLWRPPAYNTRISAQNSAFVLDGVPSADATPPRLQTGAAEKWDAQSLRSVSSYNFRPSSRHGTRTASPVFTARVSKSCKQEIRRAIEDRYGYNAASLYSDLGGLATYVARRPEVLLDRSKTT